MANSPSGRLEDALYCAEFLDIADGGRGAVGVHVVHLDYFDGASFDLWKTWENMGKTWETLGKHGENMLTMIKT